MLSEATGIHSASSRMPALPCVHTSSSDGSSCRSFHAIACSRAPLPTRRTFTVRLRERLFYVGQQVVGVLDSAREADEPLGDPELRASLRLNGCVSHRRRMRNEAFDAAE